VTGFRISETALADIESIARYTTEQWGTAQRDRYMLGLEEEFRTLARNPKMAAERRDFTPPVRIHAYEKHLIVYVIDDFGILIGRVLHGNMDVPAHVTGRTD
jgi:toxin ParE1/3/4